MKNSRYKYINSLVVGISALAILLFYVHEILDLSFEDNISKYGPYMNTWTFWFNLLTRIGIWCLSIIPLITIRKATKVQYVLLGLFSFHWIYNIVELHLFAYRRDAFMEYNTLYIIYGATGLVLIISIGIFYYLRRENLILKRYRYQKKELETAAKIIQRQDELIKNKEAFIQSLSEKDVILLAKYFMFFGGLADAIDTEYKIDTIKQVIREQVHEGKTTLVQMKRKIENELMIN